MDWGSVLQKCCVHGFSPCVRSLLRHRRRSFQEEEETSEQEVLDRSLFFNFRGDLRHKDRWSDRIWRRFEIVNEVFFGRWNL